MNKKKKGKKILRVYASTKSDCCFSGLSGTRCSSQWHWPTHPCQTPCNMSTIVFSSQKPGKLQQSSSTTPLEHSYSLYSSSTVSAMLKVASYKQLLSHNLWASNIATSAGAKRNKMTIIYNKIKKKKNPTH